MKETDHTWISVSFDDKEILIELIHSMVKEGEKTIWEKIIRICYKLENKSLLTTSGT
ncbi:MAG: hypothetical protein ACFFDT_33715 [Candidatus Hodarchaeota archaeon]